MQSAMILAPTVPVARTARQQVPFKSTPRRVVSVKYTERADSILSNEWETNWSLATYDDVQSYFANQMIKQDRSPATRLSDIMVKNVVVAHPEDRISALKDAFVKYTGLPVVNKDGGLIGVISRKDLEKPGTAVADCMTTPPVAARSTDTVSAAACMMLKYKVHRIPIVNEKNKQLIGMVTRTDVFTALAVDSGNEREILNIDM